MTANMPVKPITIKMDYGKKKFWSKSIPREQPIQTKELKIVDTVS